jgi:hypothetical protein
MPGIQITVLSMRKISYDLWLKSYALSAVITVKGKGVWKPKKLHVG